MSYEIDRGGRTGVELAESLHNFYDDHVLGAPGEIRCIDLERGYWLRARYERFAIKEILLIPPVVSRGRESFQPQYLIRFYNDSQIETVLTEDYGTPDGYTTFAKKVGLSEGLVTTIQELLKSEYLAPVSSSSQRTDHNLSVPQSSPMRQGGKLLTRFAEWVGSGSVYGAYIPRNRE